MAVHLIQDARGALRMARRDPGFSAVAVLTLALGIGATTALLSVVHALVLRPLPFTQPDRLVVLFATTPARGVSRDTTSFHDFRAWQQSGALARAAAYRQDDFNITGDGAPEPLRGLRASHELLDVLGVRPIVGRAIDEGEQRGAADVVLIGHGLWTRRYGRDPGILGRTILLNEVGHTVVGVLPPGFQFLPFQDTDVIVPVAQRPCRSCGYVRAVARLAPGVEASSAQQELDAIAAGLAQAFPDSNRGRGVSVVPLHEVAIGAVRTPLLILLGAGVCVLLIGCGNVGNLVLARGLARQRELAVRSALGAGVGRLVRQLLTESVALALVAALLGTLLAIAGSEALVASLSQRFPLPDVPFDWRLLAFALAAALLSGVLSGLPPVLMVWRSDLNGSLQQDGRGHSGGVAQQRMRGVLIVSQTALTMMLLIAAGLLVKSFVRLQGVGIGWDPRQVVTADLLLSTRYADVGRRELFLRAVTESIAALPGVQHVGVHTDSPSDGGGRREALAIEGQGDPSVNAGRAARINVVAGEFFEAVGVPIVRGRAFEARDTAESLPVAIVNEAMARRFWPEEDAIGKRLRLFYDADPRRWVTIVGVVRDVRYRYDESLRMPTSPTLTPQFFLPHAQQPYRTLPRQPAPFVSLIVRTTATTGEPAGMAAALRAAVWAVDKDQPILHVQSMDEILRRSVAAPRIYMLLLGVFAVVALLIAAAGIYGVSAYAVVRRTREIGIRLAVGATSRQIVALVLRQGLVLLGVGMAIGIAGSIALGGLIAGFLYGVAATDATTMAVVVLVFAVVAFASTYVPARRAARIDPTQAFRYE